MQCQNASVQPVQNIMDRNTKSRGTSGQSIPTSRETHLCKIAIITEGENQALVEAIPFCGEYPGPWFEDKFRSANQKDRISKAGG